MVTISGVFLDPDGSPVVGAAITFIQLKNTSDSFLRRDAGMTTAADGSYSVQLYNGRYKVMAKYQDNSEAKLGEITVSADTGPGTLNDYLLVGTADDTPSPLFMAIEKMYFDMLAMMGDVSQLAKSVDGVGTDETGNIPLKAYTENNPPPVGATSVDDVEVDDTGNIVLNAYTPDNPPPLTIPSPGSPGSYVMASMGVSGGTSGSAYKHIGQTVSGAQINPACLQRDPTKVTSWTEVISDFSSSSVLKGTWACAGYVAFGFGVSLWVRVDKPVSVAVVKSKLLKAAPQPVRNCRYATADHSIIDCEILNDVRWLPFSASLNDSTEYGPIIYKNALSGTYGPIQAFASQ